MTKAVIYCATFLFMAPLAWPQSEAGSKAADASQGTLAPAVESPPEAAKTPSKIRRPRMAGSSTGYIDNAIVGSQIRVRFDGELDLQNPDRAEFFYGKCGCYRGLLAGDPEFDPKAPGPGPGVARSANLQELHLTVEYAPRRRFSVFAEVPERSIQYTPVDNGTLPSASGFGDFRAGFKFALLASENRYLTLQTRAYFPTGDSIQGLGTNHYSIEPSLLYYQRLRERWTVSSQFGDWHPIGGSAGLPTNSKDGFAGDILTYGLGVSYDAISRETFRVAPVLEFVGWSVLSGFATGADALTTSGVNIVNAKLGARVSFGTHHSIYAGVGRELTHSHWYEEIFRLEYRFAL